MSDVLSVEELQARLLRAEVYEFLAGVRAA